MKHVFIIGSRGYKANYGGWETFVTNLVDNYNDSNTVLHISGLSQNKNENKKLNDNLYIDNFYIKQNGGIKMLLCTVKSFKYYLKYIEKENCKNCYIYILGLKLGPMLKLYKKRLRKNNIKILVNPDGLEHKRSKWNKLIKLYFLFSENLMLNNTDVIICDAKGIKKYIDNKYPLLKDKTKVITYGTNKIDLKNVDEEKILKEYDLKRDKYCLMVGRFVPENNFELVIKSFMNSKINKKLVIVSNLSSTNYYNELKQKLNCDKDERIVFIDGIYDSIKLTVIRKNAFCYIHGHSVGGTNPSLLEALSLTNLNILYDVCFNKDVGLNSCLYFKYENDLIEILNNIEKYNREKYGRECKKIIQNNYTWKIIVDKYKKVFK